MALATYNGFPGKMRDRSTKAQEEFWDANPDYPRPEKLGCMVCLQPDGLIQGHLEDYSQVQVYMPLCVTCHMMLHMRWQGGPLWEEYKLAVRHGFRGQAKANLNGIFVYLRARYPKDLRSDKFYVNDFRPATCLDFLSPIKFHHPNAPEYQGECP